MVGNAQYFISNSLPKQLLANNNILNTQLTKFKEIDVIFM